MSRTVNIGLCVFASLVAGIVSFVAVAAAGSPYFWFHPEWLWYSAEAGALFYVSVPVTVLALIAVFRPIPSTLRSILVPVCWLTIIFAWRIHKPWAIYGVFPWYLFRRDYFDMLPVALSTGLAFALVGRAAWGPNNRFERSRGATPVSQGEGR